MKKMSVDELVAFLLLQQREGRGRWPVAMMDLVSGVPFAIHIDMASANQPGDGEIVWLHAGEQEAPRWLQ